MCTSLAMQCRPQKPPPLPAACPLVRQLTCLLPPCRPKQPPPLPAPLPPQGIVFSPISLSRKGTSDNLPDVAAAANSLPNTTSQLSSVAAALAGASAAGGVGMSSPAARPRRLSRLSRTGMEGRHEGRGSVCT